MGSWEAHVRAYSILRNLGWRFSRLDISPQSHLIPNISYLDNFPSFHAPHLPIFILTPYPSILFFQKTNPQRSGFSFSFSVESKNQQTRSATGPGKFFYPIPFQFPWILIPITNPRGCVEIKKKKKQAKPALRCSEKPHVSKKNNSRRESNHFISRIMKHLGITASGAWNQKQQTGCEKPCKQKNLRDHR